MTLFLYLALIYTTPVLAQYIYIHRYTKAMVIIIGTLLGTCEHTKPNAIKHKGDANIN